MGAISYMIIVFILKSKYRNYICQYIDENKIAFRTDIQNILDILEI